MYRLIAADLNGNEHVRVSMISNSARPVDSPPLAITKNFTFPRSHRSMKADGDGEQGLHLQRRAAVIRRNSRAVSQDRPSLLRPKRTTVLPEISAANNDSLLVEEGNNSPVTVKV